MSRQDHIEWCKNRAKEYIKDGDLQGAFASMMSDLNTHEETSGHSGIELGMMLLMSGNLSTAHKMEEFIDGFN